MSDAVLRARWSKKEQDVVFDGPRSETRLLYHALSVVALGSGEAKSLLDTLEARGYDITTLRFSIKTRKGTKDETSNDTMG